MRVSPVLRLPAPSSRRRVAATCRCGVVTLLCAAPGCLLPNQYATARPLPKGELQVGGAAETFRFLSHTTDGTSAFPERAHELRGYTLIPNVLVRYGLTGGVTAGAKVGLTTAPRGDLLVSVAHLPLDAEGTTTFGLAVDPALQIGAGGQLYDLAVPVGVDGSDLAIVLAPGVTVQQATSGDDTDGSYRSGPAVRCSGGVRWWIAERFALHPEATWMRGIGKGAFEHWSAGLALVMRAKEAKR